MCIFADDARILSGNRGWRSERVSFAAAADCLLSSDFLGVFVSRAAIHMAVISNFRVYLRRNWAAVLWVCITAMETQYHVIFSSFYRFNAQKANR